MNALVKVILKLIKRYGVKEGLKKAERYKNVFPLEYKSAVEKAFGKHLDKIGQSKIFNQGNLTTKKKGFAAHGPKKGSISEHYSKKTSKDFMKGLNQKIDDYKANQRILREANKTAGGMPEVVYPSREQIIAEAQILKRINAERKAERILMEAMKKMAKMKKYEG